MPDKFWYKDLTLIPSICCYSNIRVQNLHIHDLSGAFYACVYGHIVQTFNRSWMKVGFDWRIKVVTIKVIMNIHVDTVNGWRCYAGVWCVTWLGQVQWFAPVSRHLALIQIKIILVLYFFWFFFLFDGTEARFYS